ncbi:MAG: L-arabinose isomerase [Oscillospiraceae bacterium]|jgi:L-arabinose isomerase|nr:L-arabinose isomerase [Oscillospiraceae bacterium]
MSVSIDGETKPKSIKAYAFWFLVGSQHLYGEETLRQVDAHAKVMVDELNKSGLLPCAVVFKPALTTPEAITRIMREASNAPECAGVITWMHTFSPSKMWIAGLSILNKPYCHLHTQFNRNIPDTEIDMDFMNLNQSAHGDREHGFIGARMRLPRKIIVGYWRDDPVLRQLASWMRSAAGAAFSRDLKVVRFGDNMRQVAVTEGDKVEAQIKLGWQVNTWPVGDLVGEMSRVTEADIDGQLGAYARRYSAPSLDLPEIRYQAKEEIAIRRILNAEGASAYSNTFEDLHGMEQLPGLASQDLMAQGYGYGGEGDWKTSAMVAIVKAMTEGMPGGTSFMEDYTYDLTPGHELSLGAHMLEVCPSLAADKPRVEIHALGIGNRKPPARLVFEGRPGGATAATLVDMGGRLRLIAAEVEAVKPIYQMPNLPVARVMWRSLPSFAEAAKCWILAGGAHHTVFSYDADVAMLEDWAEIMGVEFVRIGDGTSYESLKRELFAADLAWKLR